MEMPSPSPSPFQELFSRETTEYENGQIQSWSRRGGEQKISLPAGDQSPDVHPIVSVFNYCSSLTYVATSTHATFLT